MGTWREESVCSRAEPFPHCLLTAVSDPTLQSQHSLYLTQICLNSFEPFVPCPLFNSVPFADKGLAKVLKMLFQVASSASPLSQLAALLGCSLGVFISLATHSFKCFTNSRGEPSNKFVLIVFYIPAVNDLGSVFRAEKGIFQKNIWRSCIKIEWEVKELPCVCTKNHSGACFGSWLIHTAKWLHASGFNSKANVHEVPK